MDIQGNTETRKCVCIPIDNRLGTVTDAYLTAGQLLGERIEVKRKSVILSMTAFELKEPSKGQTHWIKAALSKETFARLTEEQKLEEPWIGNLRAWVKKVKSDDSNW